jgi:hypothetical protein
MHVVFESPGISTGINTHSRGAKGERPAERPKLTNFLSSVVQHCVSAPSALMGKPKFENPRIEVSVDIHITQCAQTTTWLFCYLKKKLFLSSSYT